MVLVALSGMVALSGLALTSVLDGPSPGRAGTLPARTSPRDTAPAATRSTSSPTRAPLRGLPVTSSMDPFVDPTRQVVSDGQVLAPVRSLPTYVWMPTATGRYPLVVFAQGYDVEPLTYERFCSTLASSGYVVAAPSFPLEDPTRGYGLNRGDLPNEATDVSFVITSMEHGPQAARIDPSRVAVVGHSDGADVALMDGYQEGKVDPRVDAVVADAPDPMAGPVVASRTPLLLMQGTADSVVPYSSSQTVFAQVSAPRYYLTLLGAGHLAPIVGGTPWTPVLDAAVADFLDATVAGRGPGMAALPAQLRALPLSSLQVAP